MVAPSSHRRLVVANVFGGLGNQMFQYAAARSIAIRNECSLFLDTREMKAGFAHEMHNGFELTKVFDVQAKEASDKDVADVIGLQANIKLRRLVSRPILRWGRSSNLVLEPHFNFWEGIRDIAPPCYMHGYWQSERYFAQVADVIRKDFRFYRDVSGINLDWLNAIRSTTSVSLHIRRGDYVHNSHTNKFHGLLPMEYYHRALMHITDRAGPVEVFVFSDDIEWVKGTLKIDIPVHYISGNRGADSYIDMQLMACCRHNIIANSTFSWWAGWLNNNNEKIVVAPKRWFGAAGLDTTDLCPSNFTRL